MAHFRRGRDDLRVVRLNTSTPQQLSGLLSPPSGFSPAAAEPTHRSLDRQIGEYRISFIQLRASARPLH
jgi:hypothetical protein